MMWSALGLKWQSGQAEGGEVRSYQVVPAPQRPRYLIGTAGNNVSIPADWVTPSPPGTIPARVTLARQNMCFEVESRNSDSTTQ